MHYYKRNIGDYAKKAGRLTMLQHGAYTLLIDACYDRERFPTFDDAVEWTWASTEEEIQAVEFVLRKFFTPDEGFYVQNRIMEDIDAYQQNAATNKRIAIERETNRREKGTNRAQAVDDSSRTGNEPPPNHKPLTINQEPKKTRASASPSSPEKPEAVQQSTWDDWLLLRKRKSAPVTGTVLRKAASEANLAGMSLEAFLQIWCARGSQGLEASWLKPAERGSWQSQQPVTVPSTPGRDPALLKLEEDDRRAAPPSLETLARLAELRRPKC